MNLQGILNKEQEEAVLHGEGPLLILAGAGSGKTRVLTYRIAHLIADRGVSPWNILAITFTNKAAGEMRERVDQLAGFGAEQVWVSTFHATCVRILRRHIDCIGYQTNFTIYDTDDSKSLIRDVCRQVGVDTKVYKERSLLSAISAAKNEMITPEQFARDAAGDYGQEQVAKVYQAYQQQLYRNNALDFDDLLQKTVELFSRTPEVLAYYQERFRYILVDEYQDTNTVQFEFVRLLADRYRNLCVVGDDDQSIYKFRGANIENILSFERHYPDAKVIKLEQNYRSTGNILKAANGVISNNRGRKEKRLWTEAEEGKKIPLLQFDSAYQEAEYIVGDIRSKVRSGFYEYRDFAILYRTNAQSRLFEEKLLLSGTPYKIIGGVNFYARKEIKDLLAYLKTVDNGQDDLAVKRIINVPRRGIGNTTIARIEEYAGERGISFYEGLLQAENIPGISRAQNSIRSFVKPIQDARAKADSCSVKELLEKLIEDSGYVRELEEADTDEAKNRMENIDELFSKIAGYEESAQEPSLSGFLQEVALVADVDSLENDQNYVVLMTLHSAKGLEFPNVYLTGMEEGVFPSYLSFAMEDPADLEEERRLCYVGITRAKRELTLTWAKMRMQRGETQYSMPSRFLREVPKEVLDGAAGERGDQKRLEGFLAAGGFGQPAVFGQTGRTGQSGAAGQTGRTGFSGVSGQTGRTGQSGAAGQTGRNSRFQGKYQSAIMTGKQMQVNKAEGLSYGVGDRVSHVKFGQGTVMNIADGGKDYEVQVNFDSCGVKKMFASFAKLKKCP